MRVRRVCPICRQQVKHVFRIYLNIEPSQSQMARTARPNESSTIVENNVVDLLDSEDEAVAELSGDDHRDSDEEYPDLENLEYSEIEPDIAEIDELQDALVRANRDLNQKNQQIMGLGAQVDRLQADIQAARSRLAASESKAASLLDELEGLSSHFITLQNRMKTQESVTWQLKAENQLLQSELNSLMMKRVAAEYKFTYYSPLLIICSIERILCDLTMEQAIKFGSDLSSMSPNQIKLRMAALVETSKKDRERAGQLESSLKYKTCECEQLERKLAKLKIQLESSENLQPPVIEPSNHTPLIRSPAKEKPKMLSTPILRPPPALKLPSAPPKFASGLKKSFQVPDGTGGSKRQYPF